MGVHDYECVWDEFSEYLLETRFLTSANYNPHPLRIFFASLLERKLPVISEL